MNPLSLLLTVGLLSSAAACAECDIQLSDAQVNYGQTTRSELLAQSGNRFSSGELRVGDARELEVMVSCDRPTPLTLQFIGPEKESDSYRFGASGRVTLVLHDVMIDDRRAEMVRGETRDAKMAFRAGQPLSFWFAGSPASGRVLRASLTVTAWMPSAATRVRDSELWRLDGSVVVGGD